MAVEDIFDALDRQADLDREAMLAHAKEQADRIMQEARVQADEIRTSRLAQVERELSLLRNKRTNTAQLEAKKRASAQKEKLIHDVFAEAETRMRDIRQTLDYSDRLERLLFEALGDLEGEGVVVHVDPRDKDVALAALARIGRQVEVQADMSCAGGVKVTLSSGLVTRLNTLESRLVKAQRVGKWNVAAALFGS